MFPLKCFAVTDLGGKHFSKNLAPLKGDGEEPDVESQTPDKWAVIFPYDFSDFQTREPKGEDDSDESSSGEASEESEEDEESAGPVSTTVNPNLVKKGPVKANPMKGPQELTRKERYEGCFRGD